MGVRDESCDAKPGIVDDMTGIGIKHCWQNILGDIRTRRTTHVREAFPFSRCRFGLSQDGAGDLEISYRILKCCRDLHSAALALTIST